MPPFPSPTKTWHSTSYPKISPTRPELSAKGKFVVVTGGGTGIGAETARSFTQAGATRIALLGRRLQPLLDTKASIESQYPGVEVLTASADVTDAAQVEEAFTSFTNNSTVKIDVLISNAGTMGPPGAILASDPADFMAGVNSNIAGALHVARAFLRSAAPDAVVVNVSSSASHDTFGDIFGSYSVGKWGAIRLWDFVGKNNPGMRVYHIQPGVVDTDMNRAAGGVEAMGYEDHVSLPASFSVWLASPEATFLNLKFLFANWDVDELKEQTKEIQQTNKYSMDLVGWPFGGDKDIGKKSSSWKV